MTFSMGSEYETEVDFLKSVHSRFKICPLKANKFFDIQSSSSWINTNVSSNFKFCLKKGQKRPGPDRVCHKEDLLETIPAGVSEKSQPRSASLRQPQPREHRQLPLLLG